uniref:Protein kinase domain-containing protein n=1 Tax=Glossina austeni TaxID=7395 RepID=A0A1A9UDE1_GLOAU
MTYTAPEVFTKTNNDGHGRAVDIWSVGCVVVEMASGKVGMGEKTEAPENLSQEGHHFIDHCLQRHPKDRMTAFELLDYNFLYVLSFYIEGSQSMNLWQYHTNN